MFVLGERGEDLGKFLVRRKDVEKKRQSEE